MRRREVGGETGKGLGYDNRMLAGLK